MQKRLPRFFLVMAFCVVLATGAAAKTGLFIGVQGGWSMQKPSLGEVSFDSDSSFLYGARIGVKVLMFAVEANYFRTSHDLVLEGSTPLDGDGVDAGYNYLGVNARVYIPLILLHPYLTVGYGSYSAKLEDIGKDSNRGFNLGLGVELNLGDKLSLIAQGQYHQVKMEIGGEDLKLKNYTLSGGFNIYF